VNPTESVLVAGKAAAGRWRTRLLFITVAACPVLVMAAYRIVYMLTYADSDFFTFWLAGHMTWTGENPYVSAQWLGGHHQFGANWIPNPIFPYPLPLATLMAPLGGLRLDQAYVVWMALSFVLLLVAATLVLVWRPDHRLKHYVVPVAAGLVLFRPLWVTVRDGQLGGLLLLLLVLAACLWEDGRGRAGGVALALIALKPSLGLPILALALIWLLATKRWGAVAAVVATELGLLVLGLIRDPRWPVEFLTIGQSKLESTFGFSPSVWGMAGAVCGQAGPCLLWTGGLLTAGLVVATGWFLIKGRNRLSPLAAIGLSVSVAVLVTPYIWAYDQILLVLPIVYIVTVLMRRGQPYLVGALFFLMVDVAAIGLLLVAVQVGQDYWSGLIPAVVGAALVWSIMATAAEREPFAARPALRRS